MCRYLVCLSLYGITVYSAFFGSACTTVLKCTCKVPSFICTIILYTAITLLITVRVWMLICVKRHVIGEWEDICSSKWPFKHFFVYDWTSCSSFTFASVVIDVFTQTPREWSMNDLKVTVTDGHMNTAEARNEIVYKMHSRRQYLLANMIFMTEILHTAS